MKKSWAPHARQRDLIVKRVAGELLVYDVERHRAHSLGALLGSLWKRCDGKTAPAALAAALDAELGTPVDEALVWVGLERLAQAHLLREALPVATSKAQGSTRRQWLRQASAIGLALATITVPTLAEAATAVTNADCARRMSNACGNVPCSQNPGNVCRAANVGGVLVCSCTQN